MWWLGSGNSVVYGRLHQVEGELWRRDTGPKVVGISQTVSFAVAKEGWRGPTGWSGDNCTVG